MSIEDIYDSFNKIKNIVYDHNYPKLNLTDLATLIIKEPKTPDEIQILQNIYKYISVIKVSISNLGQKLMELFDASESEGIIVYDQNNLEAHTKDIILYLDQFIDSVAALNRIYNFEESKYELTIMETMLRSNRDNIMKRANHYRKNRAIRQDIDAEEINSEFKNFLTDMIDIVIKEAVKLSVLKIHTKIREHVYIQE